MDREELLKNAKPILFNTEMVRAILEGRKTVTRRCVKAKSKNACGFYVTFRKSDNAFMGVYDYDENEFQFDSPQTQPAYPGDILYVRETWNHYIYDNLSNRTHKEGYFYKASSEMKSELPDFVQYHWGEKWKPSIHMPKEAARIFLKVTDVRVERLQDMNGRDVLKEGVNSLVHPDAFYFDMNQLDMFERLWNSTIKKSDIDIYGWDADPWVWVIEFERIEVK